jgi:hypothetical protein
MLPLIADFADKPRSHPIFKNDKPVGTSYRRTEPIGRFILKR